jgi:hypothetical protein
MLKNTKKESFWQVFFGIFEELCNKHTGLAKVAVECSADTFVVNQSWFSASTFVVKIPAFAKPKTVRL